MIDADVLVIGGGILGCAAAYHLAKRGVAVVLVERGALGSGATGATTAGITLQNRAPERLPFYSAAAEYWPTLSDELKADVGYCRCGSLSIAYSEEEFAQLQKWADALRALELELLPAEEARHLAPWLTDGIAGACYCPADGYAEPDQPLPAFAAAAERNGATLLINCPVETLTQEARGGFLATTPHGKVRARKVVNAAGAWAGRVAGMLGVGLPITLDPLQAFATETTEPWMDKVVLDRFRKLTLKQNRNGKIIIGGGWTAAGDLDGGPQRLKAENRQANLTAAHAAIPRLAALQLEREWVGLEGRSPDRYPFFGEVKSVPGFYLLACVHGGFTLSPLLGEQLAELIVEGRTTFPMHKFTNREFQ